MNRKKTFSNIKIWIDKYGFIFLVIVLCVVKQLMVSNLPIFARDAGGPDQYKLLVDAEMLFDGSYFTDTSYDIFTLFKRAISFPLFLSFCHKIGLSYLAGYTLLYTLSCVLFLHALGLVVYNRFFKLIAFAYLLFCPYTYAYSVQMMYNLSFTAPLAVAAISCLLITFYKRYDSMMKLLFWSAMASVYLTGLWLNREDSVWIFPLIFCYIFIGTVDVAINRKIYSIKRKAGLLILYLVPAISVFAGNCWLSYVNYAKYGVFTTNDYTSTNFERAYNCLLKIQQDYFPDCCSITKEMLDLGYGVSPSLCEIKPYMDYYYENGIYDFSGSNPYDGEIEDSLMNIALRDAAASLGYYTNAIDANIYWGRVADELEMAFDQNILPSRSMFFFGSTLHHPWNSNQNYIKKWAEAACDLMLDTLKHETFSKPSIIYNTTTKEISDRYESLTLNYSIDRPKYAYTISGWSIPCDNSKVLSFSLLDENMGIISSSPPRESPDIAQAYMDNPASSNCRFSFSDTSLYKPAYIEVETAETMVVIPVRNDFIEYVEAIYYFDVCDINTYLDADENYANYIVNRLRRIANNYSLIAPICFACFVFIYVCRLIVLAIRLKCDHQIFEKWLFQSTFLGCMLVMLIAIAFVHAFMWGSLFYAHTIGVLSDALIASSIALDGSAIYKYIVRKLRNKNDETV